MSESKQAKMFSRAGAPIETTSHGDLPPTVDPIDISPNTTGWPSELLWNDQRFNYDPGLSRQYGAPSYRASENT